MRGGSKVKAAERRRGVRGVEVLELRVLEVASPTRTVCAMCALLEVYSGRAKETWY